MRKHLNKRGRVVAAATTGAILAGSAGIAYFVSSAQDTGTVIGGEIAITASVGNGSSELFPITDNDGVFTIEDVIGNEAGGAMMAIDVPVDTDDDVYVEVGLMDIVEFGGDQDLWITFCDTDALEAATCSDLLEVGNLSLDTWNVLSETVLGGESFSKSAWVFLRNDPVNVQEQGLATDLVMYFEARTTGEFA